LFSLEKGILKKEDKSSFEMGFAVLSLLRKDGILVK